jgi:hypothetical protein
MNSRVEDVDENFRGVFCCVKPELCVAAIHLDLNWPCATAQKPIETLHPNICGVENRVESWLIGDLQCSGHRECIAAIGIIAAG